MVGMQGVDGRNKNKKCKTRQERKDEMTMSDDSNER